MKKLLLIITLILPLLLSKNSWGSSLPQCEGSPNSDSNFQDSFEWDNCQGTFTITDLGEYVGEYKDGKMHGQGTATLLDGIKYVGEYKDGKMHGQGTMTIPDGTKYVGEWKDDKMHGQGTYTYSDGTKDVGIWKENKFLYAKKVTIQEDLGSSLPECQGSPLNGSNLLVMAHWDNCQGTITFPDGEKYVGEWKDSKTHGQGTYTYANGEQYVGEFKYGKRDGQGTYTFENGDQYIGELKDDKMNGQGTYMHSSGDKYVGEQKDDLKHGQGTYTWKNGAKYVGEFKDDREHGQGTYTYPDGIKEEGIHKDGKFLYAKKVTIQEDLGSSLPECQGSPLNESNDQDLLKWNNCKGTYIWLDGEQYIGGWKDDTYHGQGTYTYANGDKYVGEHKDGKINGQGTFTWTNGDQYIGEHKDGKANGPGTYTYANGEKYVGEFKDDLFNGQGAYAYPDGTKREGIWKDHKLFNTNESINVNGTGSSFQINSDGYLITNDHVIDKCVSVKVSNGSINTYAKVLARDRVNDLALLLASEHDDSFFSLSLHSAKLMDSITVAGYPFGTELSSSVKVTRGIVSSISGMRNNYSQFQIDAAVQPGNSGGPVVNESGNVIGVTVAKLDFNYMLDEYGEPPENINFAIKSSIVSNFLESNNIDFKLSSSKLDSFQLRKLMNKATFSVTCYGS